MYFCIIFCILENTWGNVTERIAYAAAFDASQRNTISDSPMGEISNQIQRDAIVSRNVVTIYKWQILISNIWFSHFVLMHEVQD